MKAIIALAACAATGAFAFTGYYEVNRPITPPPPGTEYECMVPSCDVYRIKARVVPCTITVSYRQEKPHLPEIYYKGTACEATLAQALDASAANVRRSEPSAGRVYPLYPTEEEVRNRR